MLRVLIPAAGLGTRTNLNYPKAIHKYKKIPIIVRILKKTYKYDNKPIIVLNKKNQNQISRVINDYGFEFQKTIQNKPSGMLDAILTINKIKNIKLSNIILIWGDLCNPQRDTINKLLSLHKKYSNDLTIASIMTNHAYTEIIRRKNNSLKKILENRNKIKLNQGERDVGIFILNKKYLNYLSKNKKKFISNNEFSFLKSVEFALKYGLKTNAYQVATHKDTISFNKMNDLK